jgi:general secretion pathway protein B
MSYILNALRKSEQERLAQQPDTVTGRILINQPQVRHKTSKIIILLIITNLIVVAGFFWFIRKESALKAPVIVNKTITSEKIQAKPIAAPPIQESSQPKTVEKRSAPLSPPKAEPILSRKLPAAEHPIPKSALEKKPVIVAVEDPKNGLYGEPNPIEPLSEEPVKTVEKPTEAAIENKGIPYLAELDPDFRRTIPELKINVFVYSDQPADRFVMIDMVKYTVGDRIKESVTLKEIRPDSLVVAYNNRIFRIKRP